eukprot:Mycagemm_TRINITY_DN10053_c0_g2::TRINITY_DN10053_c0_g2_i1::g.2057::m.2057 type:complete len:155 gc:universal TRINITY_DN10053_c0_g2_i1:23-487(+)
MAEIQRPTTHRASSAALLQPRLQLLQNGKAIVVGVLVLLRQGSQPSVELLEALLGPLLLVALHVARALLHDRAQQREGFLAKVSVVHLQKIEYGRSALRLDEQVLNSGHLFHEVVEDKGELACEVEVPSPEAADHRLPSALATKLVAALLIVAQ